MFTTLCHTKILAKYENGVSVISVSLNVMDLDKIAPSNLHLKSKMVSLLSKGAFFPFEIESMNFCFQWKLSERSHFSCWFSAGTGKVQTTKYEPL